MMIWGGLLYLTRFDVKTVYGLSRNREEMLERYPHAVRPQYFRYLPLKSGWQPRPLVKGVFDLYRALGGLRRGRNRIEERFAEQPLVAMARYRGAVAYEEALLTPSDTRFVLELIRRHDGATAWPLNYVSLEAGEYDAARRRWRLELHDQFGDGRFEVTAGLVINATGPHVDALNQRFAIVSPYKHVFSKGAMLSFVRPPGHDAPLIFELGAHRDALAFVPWGPVSYWGPTETAMQALAGAAEPSDEEVAFLLEQANRTFNHALTPRDIVAYRCGVRPLAVAADYRAQRYPLELSRHHRIHVERRRPWIALYGGKFTSALAVAERVAVQVQGLLGAPPQPGLPPSPLASAPHEADFPGLDERFPAIGHCIEHEYCLTIDDYLRRRTNIAQWVARNGLGNAHEHLPLITRLAGQLPRAAPRQQRHTLEHYVAETARIFDRLQGLAPR